MLKLVAKWLKIGSPKVDLKISKKEAKYHEIISGNFHIKGGTKSQKLKRLECMLMKETQNGILEPVQTVTTILMSKQLKEEEDLIVPFTFQLSPELEPSSQRCTYKFHTNLIFADNKVSDDHDELVVKK
ncbi:sporulation protein [Bacillus sp. B1-b2]|uniref:sporulation protein n=1 Tax=Bacillus sp. B1-b2 TaxID=2653201 RepID=UPI00186A95B6|nr:sporulation protein [Bacillus sp. B1-b2]